MLKATNAFIDCEPDERQDLVGAFLQYMAEDHLFEFEPQNIEVLRVLFGCEKK